MKQLVTGPMWSVKGLDLASGRYPLRVESHVSQMVDRLLPGVTTVTTQARYFLLHPLVWSEANRRGLDLDQARELMRRCEVVVAGASVLHEPHDLPAAHGADRVGSDVREYGVLPIARLQQTGQYSTQVAGFAGAYRGAEERLGLLSPSGRGLDAPGPRFNERLVRRSLDGLFDLAEREDLGAAELRAAEHLCICQASQGDAGRFLRSVLCAPEPLPDLRRLDDARSATARLIGRVLAASPRDNTESGFSSAIRSGTFIAEDQVASSLPESTAWRGVALRNFTVGAWRRLWSLLVDELDEPLAINDLGDRLAREVPDVSVDELMSSLPPSMEGTEVLDAEGELRYRATRRVDVEIALLALAARRTDELDGETLLAYSPRPKEVLSPHWLKDYLTSLRHEPLPVVVRDLVERLVNRARRVALSKMEISRAGVVWMPTRIDERNGILHRLSDEGWGDVGLRIASFCNVLAGAGVIERTSAGWSLSAEGEELIGRT